MSKTKFQQLCTILFLCTFGWVMLMAHAYLLLYFFASTTKKKMWGHPQDELQQRGKGRKNKEWVSEWELRERERDLEISFWELKAMAVRRIAASLLSRSLSSSSSRSFFIRTGGCLCSVPDFSSLCCDNLLFI